MKSFNLAFEKQSFAKSPIIYGAIILFLSSLFYFCITHQKGTDFYTYFLASKNFYLKNRPYLNLIKENNLYYYPPLTAQLISPFIHLPFYVSFFIWFVISALATGCGVYILIDNKEHFNFYLLLAFGFLPVGVTLYAGQVNALVFLMLCLAYRGIQKNRLIATGLSIAAGIMLKIIPIAHFCYLIGKKKFNLAFAVLTGLMLFFAASLAFCSLQDWQDFYHLLIQWGNPGGAPTQGFIDSSNLGFNQALSGFIAKIIKNSHWAIFLWRLGAAVIVSLTVYACVIKKNENLFDLEFSLVTLAINLIMPYTWYYQLMLMLIPMILMIQRSQKFPIWLAIGYLLTDFHGLFWHHLQNPILASFPFLTCLGIWSGLGITIVNSSDRGMTEPKTQAL